MATPSKSFWQTVKVLRSKFPAGFPVRVRTVRRLNGAYGDCQLLGVDDERWFRIRVSREYNEHIQIETLLHEVAHALAWSHLHDSEHCRGYHGPEWGVQYARIYAYLYDGERDAG